MVVVAIAFQLQCWRVATRGEGIRLEEQRFFRTDGAHRHSHKQADATVYSHQLRLFPSFSPLCFLSARFRLPPPHSIIPSRFLLARFRSLFHHVQGKPINHRIPRVYCGTRLRNQQQVPCSYIPRLVLRPPVLSYILSRITTGPYLRKKRSKYIKRYGKGEGRGKEGKRNEIARTSFRLPFLRVYSVAGGKFRVESNKIILLPKLLLRVTISTRLLVQGCFLFSRVEINFFLHLERTNSSRERFINDQRNGGVFLFILR